MIRESEETLAKWDEEILAKAARLPISTFILTKDEYREAMAEALPELERDLSRLRDRSEYEEYTLCALGVGGSLGDEELAPSLRLIGAATRRSSQARIESDYLDKRAPGLRLGGEYTEEEEAARVRALIASHTRRAVDALARDILDAHGLL